jgi:hypothetical protein
MKIWLFVKIIYFIFTNNPNSPNQHGGKNHYSEVVKELARFLKKDETKYSSHSLRISAATNFVDNNGTKKNLKRLAGWKSDAVAERYIRRSDVFAIKTAKTLRGKRRRKLKKRSTFKRSLRSVSAQADTNIEDVEEDYNEVLSTMTQVEKPLKVSTNINNETFDSFKISNWIRDLNESNEKINLTINFNSCIFNK